MEVLSQVFDRVIWLEYEALHSLLLLIHRNHSYTENINGIDNGIESPLSDSSSLWFSYRTLCIVLPVLNKELLNSKTNLFPRALNEGFPDLFRKEMLYNI